MSGIRVARRYAKSVLELAKERNVLDKVNEDMTLFKNTCDASRPLRQMLISPIIKPERKKKVLSELFKGKISDLSFRFLEMVCLKNRDAVLYEIAEEVLNEYIEMQGVVKAELTTATPIDATLQQRFISLGQKISGKKVMLATKVSKEIIGGFVFKIGDKQLDNSIATKLKRVKIQFANQASTI